MTSRTRLDSDATLRIRVQPGSSSNRLSVDDSGCLRVAVTAPPAEGAANQAVCVLLAKRLKVAKSNVCIKDGRRSRDKVIQVLGLAEEEAMRRLSTT